MKVCVLGPGAYAGRVPFRGWPVPPELCDRETAAKSFELLLNQFQLADEMGFDWVSMSEHHYAPGLMTPNPIVLAGAVSQRTKNVKIALLGPLMPLANPVRTAEELSMLDSISGGRTIVLFLRGTSNEHKTYSIDGDPSPYTREITQEGVNLILKAWREPQPFAWHGQFFNFENVSVWPRTLQDPHPPVFYSGNSYESIEFAAANHFSLAIGFAPAAQVAKHVAYYKERAKEAGWEPTAENVLYRCRALCADDDEQANDVIAKAAAARASIMAQTGTQYGPNAQSEAPSTTPEVRNEPKTGEGGGNPGVGGFQLWGRPETILEQIKTYHEAGVGILDVAFAGDAYGRGGTTKAMHAFGDILPKVQAL